MRVCGVGFDPCFYVRAYRVGLDVGEDPCSDGGRGGFHHRHVRETGVGDQQRAGHAERAACLGKLANPAGAEADRGRIIPVGVGQGH